MDPLDRQVILNIWKKINKNKVLDDEIIHYCIVKLFMPTFLKLWNTQDLISRLK